MQHIKTILTACLLCFFCLSHAHAERKQDIETIAKAIGFINGGPTGNIEMDVLYDPAIPASVKHADEIIALSKKGLGRKVRLRGKKVSSIAQADSKVIFITQGIQKQYASALAKAAANEGITVSTDEACIAQGGCVIHVKTNPNVKITINTQAAKQTHTEFASVFRLMVTER